MKGSLSRLIDLALVASWLVILLLLFRVWLVRH